MLRPQLDFDANGGARRCNSALYAIARLSVCLSVHQSLRPSHGPHGCNQFLQGKFHTEILTPPPPERGVKQGRGGENQLFLSYMRQYLENGVGDTSEVTIND